MILTPLDPAVAKVEIAAVGKAASLLDWKDPEAVRAYQCRYREANHEQATARQRRFREEHPEQVIANRRRYRVAHPDRIVASQRRYREAHREQAVAASRRWALAHPEKKHEKDHRYRARLRDQLVAPVDAAVIYERDHGHCHVCGKRVKKAQASMDHLVPLSKGGAHAPWNVRLAHRRCNFRRQASGPAQLPLAL